VIRKRGSDDLTRHAATLGAMTELFRDKGPKAWRSEYTRGFDWGPDVGRERVEDER
jgi:hypothetical protein